MRIVSVLCCLAMLPSSLFAWVTQDILWTGSGSSDLWNVPANWDLNRVPTGADVVYINSTPTCRINPTVGTAVCGGTPDTWGATLGIAWGPSIDKTGTLTLNGGFLTVAQGNLGVGMTTGCNGTLNMTAGTITITSGDLDVAYAWGGHGYVKITGGTINISGSLNIVRNAGDSTSGKVDLLGGKIEAGAIEINSGGLMNITTGTLVISGNAVATVQTYIDNGKLTAYAGVGIVVLDYGVTNPGSTTIKAIVNKPNYAYIPSPVDGQYLFGDDLTLRWMSGTGAATHDLYFGTDFNSVAAATRTSPEYVGNFTASNYHYGLLDRDVTRCYWRVDEIDSGGSVIAKGNIWRFSSKYYFGGVEPIGSADDRRHLFAPYDLIELNYLGMNYVENLLDRRLNITSYTNLDSDSSTAEAYNAQYSDDMARLIESIVFEDRYSPVVRLEHVRKLTKGLMAARIPGTKALYNFRYRHDGKIYVMLDDTTSSTEPNNQGRVTLISLNDSAEPMLKVGFRAVKNNMWKEISNFVYTDALSPYNYRSPQYWNESPYVFNRNYTDGVNNVAFTGRYWLSNEDKPVEYSFDSNDFDVLTTVIGTPGEAMPFMDFMGINQLSYMHLPDRLTVYCAQTDGPKTFSSPNFNYIILRKPTGLLCSVPGYSTALLVMWDGHPSSVQALTEYGYSQIRISYPKVAGNAGGKVWLYPFNFVNQNDMDNIFAMAQSFLATGKLGQNGFPPPYLYNSTPAGLAAAANLLTKYNDPLAITARTCAQEAVDEMLFAERDSGFKFLRVFNEVRAAAWMVKLGNLLGDSAMVAKYTSLLDMVMVRMLSAESGYDGTAWGDGWTHFYATRATWLAWDASGKAAYLDAYNRAMTVYTIDVNGIYRYGVAMPAPGYVETYFGTLPLGAWGHSGRATDVDKLINLNVDSGVWGMMLKDVWNDAGAGPWAQDDANPEYLGYSLGGSDLPTDKKFVVPFGSFPKYDALGNVTLTNEPMLDNPYWAKGHDKLFILYGGKTRIDHKMMQTTIVPGDTNEPQFLFQTSGTLAGGGRTLTMADVPLVYRFNASGLTGCAIDVNMLGDSYTVDVSPDGERWFQRLYTWSSTQTKHSLDLSFLTGNQDQMIKILETSPPDDANMIVQQNNTHIERDYCRYVGDGGYFIYRLSVPDVIECHMEVIAANGYKIEFSGDGINWTEELNANQSSGGKYADGAWVRMADVSRYLNETGFIYMKFSDTSSKVLYGGKNAFLRKLRVFGAYNSPNVYVRFANATYGKGQGFTLYGLTFRQYDPNPAIASGLFDFSDLAILASRWLNEFTYSISDGKVVIEAEHYLNKNAGQNIASGIAWVDKTSDLSIGDGYIQTLPDCGVSVNSNIERDAPHVSYDVSFASAGTYYLWVKGRSNNSDANSIHYGLDGVPLSSLAANVIVLPIARNFEWIGGQNDGGRLEINISLPGKHTIDIWMAKDGAQIDRLLLTTDAIYNPVANEPKESYYNPDDLGADYNADRRVNLLDLAILGNNWLGN